MKTNHKIALSILTTAFAYGLNITGVLPILGILSETYSKYGDGTVRLLQTIPYLLTVVGSLIAGWLTTKFSKKKIVITGLLIIGVCGVFPFFVESFYLLFVTRVLIGFGFGIVSPMNNAVIAEFFEPQERVSYMGLHVVGMGVGAMVGNVLGGILAGIGYSFFYLVYALAFVCALVVQIFLIETSCTVSEKKKRMKLNSKVYVISAASFIHTLFINVYNTNISIYIFENLSRNSSVAGISTALNSCAALLMGLMFGKLFNRLGRMTLPFSVFIAAAGYACILFVPGLPGVLLASVCCGVSLSCFMAMCSFLISISVDQYAVAQASGIFSVIGSIGGLIAPIAVGNLSLKFLGADTAVNQFQVGMTGYVLFGIIVLVFMLYEGRKEKKKTV